jgi:hypothetical protein
MYNLFYWYSDIIHHPTLQVGASQSLRPMTLKQRQSVVFDGEYGGFSAHEKTAPHEGGAVLFT